MLLFTNSFANSIHTPNLTSVMAKRFSLKVMAITMLIAFSIQSFSQNGFRSLSGNYTIDKTQPTGGTNFSSFTDMASALNNFGINGPVYIEVVPGTGPYVEQVFLYQISGASASSRVTINGNGVPLQFWSTNNLHRATLTLDGADFITVTNLVVRATATGANAIHRGYAVQLMNGADHNVFTNCHFQASSTATSAMFAGFVASNWEINNSVWPGNAANNLTVDNCTITGGYYGLIFSGGSDASGIPPTVNNVITNNTIKDFRVYGVFGSGQKNAIIAGNDISRPDRETIISFYGIYVREDMSGSVITNNRIHTLAGNGTATNLAYGIHGGAQFGNLTANPGEELLIANNLIYGFSGMNGEQRGIHLLNADNVQVFHNTISLDHTSHPGTNTITGISHSGANKTVDIRNNIVQITSNSHGTKYCIQLQTAAANVVADNNVLVMGATNGSNFTGFWGGTQFTSLADWQMANAGLFDQNSSDEYPLFLNPEGGDYMPQNPGINDMGANLLSYVPLDFNNVQRTATPDPGAIEFDPPGCTPPGVLFAQNVTLTSAELSWIPTGDEALWNVEWGAEGFVPGNGNLIENISILPTPISGLEQSTYYTFYVQAVCSDGTFSEWSASHTFNTQCLLNGNAWLEDFEGAFEPICWDLLGGTKNWIHHSTSNPENKSARANFWSWPLGNDAVLTSPDISIGMMSNPALVFKWSHKYNPSYPRDELTVLISNDNGLTWLPVWNRTGEDFDSNDGASNVQPGSFIGEIVDITPFKTGEKVKIRFWAKSGFGPDLFIDDVGIIEAAPGALTGTVTEIGGGAVEGAKISVGIAEAFTDENGVYQFDALPQGIYTVTCQAEGFVTVVEEGFVVIADSINLLDFEMGYGIVAVTPGNLTETLNPGELSTQTLSIANTGTAPLTWSANITFLYQQKQPLLPEYTEPKVPFNPGGIRFRGADEAIQHNDVELETSYNRPSGDGKPLQGNRATLFINGPLVNSAGTGLNGADESILQGALGMTTFGSNINFNDGFTIADDFVVDQKWEIETFEFFAYQTGSSSTSSFTGAFMRIWDAAPNAGGEIIWGDLTTNRLLATDFANIYRNSDGPGGATNRPVMRAVCETPGLILFPGTYWVEYGLTGSLASGPWQPPITINDQTATGNAMQFSPNQQQWIPIIDVGQQGVPFIINGAASNWLTMEITQGVIEPGENQQVQVVFDADQLQEESYSATINIQHNGAAGKSANVVAIPVELIVSASNPPGQAENPDPQNDGAMVALQPVFSWTNGSYTTQASIRIERITQPFNTLIHQSGFFIGNTFDLASASKTLLPKTDYRWRVTTKNSQDETAGPWWTFQTIGQGSIAGEVIAGFTGLPLAGVTVSLEESDYVATTDESGNFILDEILEGEYNLKVSLAEYETQYSVVHVIHNQVTVADFALSKILPSPLNVQAELQSFNDVLLSWYEPGAWFPSQWLTWSGEVIGGAIGTNAAADFDVAARFTPDQLAEMPGGAITRISFAPREPATMSSYTLKIWQGSPPQMIYSQPVAEIITTAWNEVLLDTPVPFDHNEELWFGFNCSTSGGYPAGTDTGPVVEGFGNMIFWEGSWTTLTALNPTLTVNWAVKALIEPNDNSESYSLLNDGTVLSPGKKNVALSGIRTDGMAKKTRTPLGYNVYRNGTLTANIPETSFTDTSLAPGSYSYTVSAVYDEGESEQAGPAVVTIFACPPPSNLQATNISATSADITWTPGGNEALWNIEVGAPGFSPGNGAEILRADSIMENSWTATPLIPVTAYHVYVQAVCDEGDFSPWVGPESFTTPCGDYTLPFYEDFEGTVFPPGCWTVFDMDGSGTIWEKAVGFNNTPGGQGSAFHSFYQFNMQDGWLVTPRLSLPHLSQINLSFWSSNSWSSLYGKNSVLISAGSPNPADGDYVEVWSPAEVSAVWGETVLDISQFAGEKVFVAFRYEGLAAHNWYLDDVLITAVAQNAQQISLPEGWSGWSSFMVPAEEAQFEEVVASIADDMIITQYFTDVYYPAFGINTMGKFSNNHGYVTKMAAAASLTIQGLLTSTTINLESGWNLMPVPVVCSLDADDVFGEIPGLVIAFEVAGNAIYYPEAGIFTLEEVATGKAYWVKVAGNTTFTFPQCTKKAGMHQPEPLRYEAPEIWNQVSYTGSSHVVVFAENAVDKLKEGDIIGAFTHERTCAGITRFDGKPASMALFGNDITSATKDGFDEGETLNFKIYRAGTEYLLSVSYCDNAPNADGRFAMNGLTVITVADMYAAGIEPKQPSYLSIFPNPSSGIFNIEVGSRGENLLFEVSNVKGNIVSRGNISGNQVLDLSAHPVGVYFIRIFGNNYNHVKKLIIK
jgi:hypothetical protein